MQMRFISLLLVLVVASCRTVSHRSAECDSPKPCLLGVEINSSFQPYHPEDSLSSVTATVLADSNLLVSLKTSRFRGYGFKGTLELLSVDSDYDITAYRQNEDTLFLEILVGHISRLSSSAYKKYLHEGADKSVLYFIEYFAKYNPSTNAGDTTKLGKKFFVVPPCECPG